METQGTTKTQSGTIQIILFVPTTHTQGASKGIITEQGKPKEIELTSKVKEKVSIQALVTLPTSSTPSIQTL